MVENSYYSIACNDLEYLEDSITGHFYNPMALSAMQIAEKMLKSVAEVTCVGIEKLMVSNNLRAIYDVIHREDSDFVFDRNKLSTLKDYFYDLRYPNDCFINVTRDECADAVKTMYEVVELVNTWRKAHNYPVMEFEDKSNLVGTRQMRSIDCF